MKPSRAVLAIVPIGLLLSPVLDSKPFIRGDTDRSRGLSITDAITIISALFVPEGADLDCRDAADVNDDGFLNVSDAIHILTYLFLRGEAPAAPFSGCGVDPTQEDSLGCGSSLLCATGDGRFYVVDRSSGFSASGGLAIAKRELLLTIDQFSDITQLGIFFFDSTVTRFPADGPPALATTEVKAQAKAFVESVSPGSGSCIRAGFLAALELIEQSTAARDSLLYFGDGGGTCPGEDEAAYLEATLEEVTAQNTEGVQIHCIAVGSIPALNEQFLRSLAARNGGTYSRL
jgi:hypothetical protein